MEAAAKVRLQAQPQQPETRRALARERQPRVALQAFQHEASQREASREARA
jgi:hypothetical protein